MWLVRLQYAPPKIKVVMKYRVKSVERGLFLVRQVDGRIVETFDTIEQAMSDAMGEGMSFVVMESEPPFNVLFYGMKTWSGYIILDGKENVPEVKEEMPGMIYEEFKQYSRVRV